MLGFLFMLPNWDFSLCHFWLLPLICLPGISKKNLTPSLYPLLASWRQWQDPSFVCSEGWMNLALSASPCVSCSWGSGCSAGLAQCGSICLVVQNLNWIQSPQMEFRSAEYRGKIASFHLLGTRVLIQPRIWLGAFATGACCCVTFSLSTRTTRSCSVKLLLTHLAACLLHWFIPG